MFGNTDEVPHDSHQIIGRGPSILVQESTIPTAPVEATVPDWFTPLQPLSERMASVAKKELNEVQSTRLELLWDLRRRVVKKGFMFGVFGSVWTDEWPNEVQDNDILLMAFLRVSKMNVARAFERIKVYVEAMENLPFKPEDCKWNQCRDALETGMTVMLPTRDKYGRAISVFKPAMMNKHIKFVEYQRAMLTMMATHVLNEDTQIKGFVVIDDFKDAGLFDMPGITRGSSNDDMRAFVKLVQEAMPLRIRGIYIMSPPWYVSLLFTITKPFLKAKIRNRVQVLSNREDIFQSFDNESLPRDLGGSLDLNWEIMIKERIVDEGAMYNDRELVQIVIETDLSKSLGWTLSPDESSGGVKVLNIDEKGEAKRLGIRENDVVLMCDDNHVKSHIDLSKSLHPHTWFGPAQSSVTILLRRDI